ncbi:S26 family signal peptidase [Haloarcula limicola]|uniref:S26 family signal peptidase n=1 Tax=Haloarcula limicola TaxID=1429915 RepID=UPI0013914C49|nr:S26 family signal peptidase [Halomicroarcula limicola]
MSSDEGLSAIGDDGGPGALVYVKDVVGSAGAVLLVGLLLFSVSGVWPPLVAIESPSMDPHIQKGDLVFVMEEERFAGPNATHGVVTYQRGESYVRFQRPGDVIVYAPDGDTRTTPIIHRAMFYVEDGENWYDRADPAAIGAADDCAELTHCPAPHAGFITKGDNNARYDQVGMSPISEPVEASWVVGTAEWRVPLLGEIRLGWNRAAALESGPVTSANDPVPQQNGTAAA